MSSSGKQYFARRRELITVGNSVAASLPKDVLRDEGLVDENDDPVEDARARAYIDVERGVVGIEAPLDLE